MADFSNQIITLKRFERKLILDLLNLPMRWRAMTSDDALA